MRLWLNWIERLATDQEVSNLAGAPNSKDKLYTKHLYYFNFKSCFKVICWIIFSDNTLVNEWAILV